jgi:DNA mismatch repair protein MutL
MTLIKILPQDLINQIAAGEVIERPASVVKELVENAIDAGAKSISVEMEGNGLELIRVSDDGTGMGEEELELAIKRHATSKISTVDDLFAIHTLGFRGEALPSILSVSRSVISVRKHQSPYGYSIDMEAGSITRRTKKGIPSGTIVEVADLFFNTPARRKFLKTAATEQRNVIDVVSRYALAYPYIRFILHVNNRTVLNLPAQSSLQDRASNVLGTKQATNLIPFRRELPGITIHGLMAMPDETRQNRSGIHAYVNNRSVRDVLLSSAVIEGYSGMLMKSRYPITVLFVDVDPAEVDVNVHPAKAEVRFMHASAVFGLVAKTMKETLVPGRMVETDYTGINSSPLPQRNDKTGHTSFEVREGMSVVYGPKALSRVEAGSLFYEPPIPVRVAFTYSDKAIIGMLHATYILLQDDSAMYILDQHAAHERVTYERLMALHSKGPLSTQFLLSPIIMELSQQEFNAFEEVSGQILAIGIDCEPFGGNTISIRSVPLPLSEADIIGAVYGLIHALMNGELPAHRHGNDRFSSMIATIACHSSVRAGKKLTLPEAAKLLNELDNIGSPITCPHGRPLFRKITKEEIERWIGRRA